MALHSDAGGHGHGTSDAETPPPDCCESGACDCACMHPAQAAVVSAAVDLGSLEHTDSVRPMSSVHASPSLPHLIRPPRSEEHTSALQSLMRISYAVFCLKKKIQNTHIQQKCNP